MNAKIKLVYFSWIREGIGLGEENVELPDNVKNIEELIQWLSRRDEKFAETFKKPETIRVAIDCQHVEHNADIQGAGEIALFPPMSGG